MARGWETATGLVDLLIPSYPLISILDRSCASGAACRATLVKSSQAARNFDLSSTEARPSAILLCHVPWCGVLFVSRARNNGRSDQPNFMPLFAGPFACALERGPRRRAPEIAFKRGIRPKLADPLGEINNIAYAEIGSLQVFT